MHIKRVFSAPNFTLNQFNIVKVLFAIEEPKILKIDPSCVVIEIECEEGGMEHAYLSNLKNDVVPVKELPQQTGGQV